MAEIDEPDSKKLRTTKSYQEKMEPMELQENIPPGFLQNQPSISKRANLPFAQNASIHSMQMKPSTNFESNQQKSEESYPIDSLLHLTDVCLQKLFELVDIDDLCRLTNVCKRFRKIAEQVFGEHHNGKFDVDDSTYEKSAFRRVLCKFGLLMKSIDASEVYGGIDVNDIVKCCGTNLDSLELNAVQIDCDIVKSMFCRLTILGLYMCDFTGNANSLFQNCSQLERLMFDPKDACRFVAQKYPKLEYLTFDCGLAMGFTVIAPLLELNPQLKCLNLMAQSSDYFISAIVKSTKNLERLRMRQGMMATTPEQQTRGVFLQLSKLHKLIWLSMTAYGETYGKLLGPLMDAFAKENVLLEYLDVNQFEINSKDIKSIQKIKTMETLILNKIKKAAESDLIALTAELPYLSTLHLYFVDRVKPFITTEGLTKMIDNAKRLEYVALVDVRKLKINRKIYDDLLKAVENRTEKINLTIHIVGCQSTCAIDVPQTILEGNMSRLEVMYDAQEDCKCDQCAE